MYRTEYKKHFIGMTESLAPFLTVLVISFAVWTSIFTIVVVPLLKEYKSFRMMPYEYLIERKEVDDNYDSLWKLENIITVSGRASRRMNTNLYVQSDGENPLEYRLGENEAAVSSKLAKNLNIKQGDSIYVNLAIYDEPKEYVVKYIFTYLSDYYLPLDNTDFSVAVLGYNKNIIESASGRYISFLDGQSFIEFNQKEKSYISKHSVSNDLEAIWDRIVLILIVMHIILLVMAFSAVFYAKQQIQKEITKYYHEGYERHRILSFERRDYLFFLITPFLVHFLIMAGFQLMSPYFLAISFVTTAVMVIMALIFCVIGGSKFGKAD